MARNAIKVKQRRRDHRKGITKDDPLAKARRSTNMAKKTAAKRKTETFPSKLGSVSKPRRSLVSPGTINAPRTGVAAKRATARTDSQTERTATKRARSYSAGIKQGGQSGRKSRGLRTPSRGARGSTLAND